MKFGQQKARPTPGFLCRREILQKLCFFRMTCDLVAGHFKSSILCAAVKLADSSL